MNHLPTQNLRPVRGFTLIELMIVVVIVAILASLAYPSYIRQAQRAGRADATSTLLAIAAAQEKEFLKNNAYTSDLSELGIVETEANKYDLSVTLPESGGFLAVAVPSSSGSQSQAGDKGCTQFSIDHTGAKRSKGVDGDGDDITTSNCW